MEDTNRIHIVTDWARGVYIYKQVDTFFNEVEPSVE